MNSNNAPRNIFVAFTNTDCTEGRGFEVPYAASENKATVVRLGKGKYIQGSPCPVREYELKELDGEWYAPLDAIRLHIPTKEDKETEKLEKDRLSAIEKAKRAGLTQDEIDLIATEILYW